MKDREEKKGTVEKNLLSEKEYENKNSLGPTLETSTNISIRNDCYGSIFFPYFFSCNKAINGNEVF